MIVQVKHNALRKLRESLKMKREELAAAAGVSIQTVFNVEKWGAGVRLETAATMASALKVPIEKWRELARTPYEVASSESLSDEDRAAYFTEQED